MYDVVNKKAPPNLCKLFLEVSEVHRYATRSSGSRNLFTKPSRLNQQLNSFSRLGARLWNCIPSKLRVMSKKNFKITILDKLSSILGKEVSYVEVPDFIQMFPKSK